MAMGLGAVVGLRRRRGWEAVATELLMALWMTRRSSHLCVLWLRELPPLVSSRYRAGTAPYDPVVCCRRVMPYVRSQT